MVEKTLLSLKFYISKATWSFNKGPCNFLHKTLGLTCKSETFSLSGSLAQEINKLKSMINNDFIFLIFL
jgi:hypothetical protein